MHRGTHINDIQFVERAPARLDSLRDWQSIERDKEYNEMTPYLLRSQFACPKTLHF